ncbi:MAG: GTP cyclohydrolase I FolE [Deltaproteobacteria bacterium]|nr:GTP cyclohydrolase I FolE [Deltaproteobacteria bacterium]
MKCEESNRKCQHTVFKIAEKKDNSPVIRESVANILSALGEDVGREGLVKTPERVAKALQFLTKGYYEDPCSIIKSALFEEDINEMIVVKDIELYSMCEHHLLPFVGKAHVAYLPRGRIVGLSKVARVVDIFARRFQVQERLTKQIAETLNNCLEPQGVAVVIQAAHMCMQMRGVQKQNSVMVTSTMLGAFQELATRNEFMNFIKGSL